MPQLLTRRFATECIREFELAAEQRYRDAMVHAESGRRTGAIYLFGYAVEMTLKSRFLRLAGHAEDDPITTAILWGYVGQKSTTTAKALGLSGASNLHDLHSWASLIVAFRASRGLVYPDMSFARSLLANVQVVATRWNESIRYHKNVAYGHELNRTRTSCDWIRTYRTSL